MALPRFVKVGRLTKDIELRYAVSGNEIAKTSIVWSEKNGDKEETCFMDLVAFGKTATTLNNYFKKGSRVEGLFKLQQENWTASDGSNRNKHSLVLEKIMEFIDKKDDNQEAQRPQQKQEPIIEYEKQNTSMYPQIDIDEDEIPFSEVAAPIHNADKFYVKCISCETTFDTDKYDLDLEHDGDICGFCPKCNGSKIFFEVDKNGNYK